MKTFDAALQRIQNTNQTEFQKKLAKHVITWVLSATRPLKTDEVRHAFAAEPRNGSFSIEYLPEEGHLTSVCAGLIVVDQDTMIIRPVHDSVVAQLGSFPMIPAIAQRHEDMALRCLIYLDQVPSSTECIAERIRTHPLLEYAATHWFRHATRATQTAALEKHLVKFLRNTPKLSASFQVRADTFPNSITGLHAAAYFDRADWADLLLSPGGAAAKNIDRPCSNGQTALHWASHYGRCTLAELLIVQHHADINALDNEANTPLHHAVQGNHEDMVRLLLRHKATPDIGNRKGWTPFRWAVRYGYRSVARPLAENKVEIDAQDTHRGTPFTWAVEYKQLELVKLLLENGWDVDWTAAKDGWTALRHAAQYGSEPLARLLLAHGATVDLCDGQGGFTPLRWAVLYGNTAVVRILLEAGADVNASCVDGYTPLIQAGKRGNKTIVWLLVERGALLDRQGKDGATALHLAVQNGSKSIAWFLVENGAKVDLQDQEGMTALHRAVAAGDDALVWYLLEKGADPGLANNDGCDCLHLAAQLGHEKILKLLIDRGVDTGRQDKKGQTVFHHAAQGGGDGRVDMVRALVTRGARHLDVPDHSGLTALHLAARQGHGDTVQALVEGHADLDIQDENGFTALHHAVLGRLEPVNIIMSLVNGRANLDVHDHAGKTALIHAAQRGDAFTTLCLLKHGADGSAQDNHQWTARDHAANGGHHLILKLLSSSLSTNRD